MKTTRITNVGKGGGQEILPSRHALNTLTGGDASQRTLGMYAKASPLDVSGVAAMKLARPKKVI